MAINLNKTEKKTLYYYSKEGLTMGPCELEELLGKIKGDTLVYREGIEWTNAEKIPELKKYFSNVTPQVIDYPKEANKKNNYWPYILFLLVLILGMIYNLSNTQKSEPTNVDTTFGNVDSSGSISPSGEPIARDGVSPNGVELKVTNIGVSGEYYSNGISYDKDKIVDHNKETWWTPNPTNGDNSYVILNFESPETEVNSMGIINGSYGRYYYDNSRITKLRVSFSDGTSEDFDLIENQDFQNIQFQQKHQTSFVKIEPLERIKGNRWDDLCISELRLYGNESTTDNASMQNARGCETSDILTLLQDMFEHFGNGNFDANEYFSSNISQYINLSNISPNELNRIYASSDFKNAKNVIQEETLTNINTSSGCKVNFISKFTCFRPSKQKWQKCMVDLEIIVVDGKIKSYVEKRVLGLQFSESSFD